MKALKMPGFNIFYNAPVLILMFAMPHAYTSHEYDCAASAENMLIAARSLGIGSCWIGLGMPLGSDRNTLAELDVRRVPSNGAAHFRLSGERYADGAASR